MDTVTYVHHNSKQQCFGSIQDALLHRATSRRFKSRLTSNILLLVPHLVFHLVFHADLILNPARRCRLTLILT